MAPFTQPISFIRQISEGKIESTHMDSIPLITSLWSYIAIHTWTTPPWLPDAMYRPSVDQANAVTISFWPLYVSIFFLFAINDYSRRSRNIIPPIDRLNYTSGKTGRRTVIMIGSIQLPGSDLPYLQIVASNTQTTACPKRTPSGGGRKAIDATSFPSRVGRWSRICYPCSSVMVGWVHHDEKGAIPKERHAEDDNH